MQLLAITVLWGEKQQLGNLSLSHRLLYKYTLMDSGSFLTPQQLLWL